jgi:hypothetical protein
MKFGIENLYEGRIMWQVWSIKKISVRLFGRKI